MGYEEGEGDLQAQLDEARKRIQTQEVFLVDLRQRVNKWEDTFACQQVLMQLLNDMFEHYSQHNRTRGRSTTPYCSPIATTYRSTTR